MNKLILMLTLIAMIGIVSEAKADSCTESSIQGVYSNIFGVPYSNRATGFIEIDKTRLNGSPTSAVELRLGSVTSIRHTADALKSMAA